MNDEKKKEFEERFKEMVEKSREDFVKLEKEIVSIVCDHIATNTLNYVVSAIGSICGKNNLIEHSHKEDMPEIIQHVIIPTSIHMIQGAYSIALDIISNNAKVIIKEEDPNHTENLSNRTLH